MTSVRRLQKARMGALPPRYSLALNPHADYRATSCPACKAKTRVRKIPLVIHVEGVGLLILRKTCRLCLHCETVVAHQAEIESAIQASAEQAAAATPDYLVLGTVGQRAWRLSEPFFTYGPYRPFCTVTCSPSSSPSTRGRLSSFSASSSVTVSSAMDFGGNPVRGLAEAGASSPSSSVTYGPNRRPWRPPRGRCPGRCREAHPVELLIEKLFGSFHSQLVRRDVVGDVHPLVVPLQVRGRHRPTRTTMSLPASGNELTSRASMSPMSPTRDFRPGSALSPSGGAK